MAQAHLVEPALGPADLARVGCRSLVMVGDDDEVRLEHAIELYRALPEGELAIVAGTSHGLLVEKPQLCNRIILEFLEHDPVPTLAPIRRRKEQAGPGWACRRPTPARVTGPVQDGEDASKWRWFLNVHHRLPLDLPACGKVYRPVPCWDLELEPLVASDHGKEVPAQSAGGSCWAGLRRGSAHTRRRSACLTG